jgi:pimeloyl-ACP methyl ester carboxylesterase
VTPVTRYARSGDHNIAYQVYGDGPVDVVFVTGLISHVEHLWEEPGVVRLFDGFVGLGARLILMDRLGVGLSDPVTEPPSLHDEVDDVNAVLDAAGSERAALFGYATGGPYVIQYAAKYPERTRALVLHAAFARNTRSDDLPWANTREERQERIDELFEHWGEGMNVELIAPSAAGDERLRAWFARLERLSAAPGQMRKLWRAMGRRRRARPAAADPRAHADRAPHGGPPHRRAPLALPRRADPRREARRAARRRQPRVRRRPRTRSWGRSRSSSRAGAASASPTGACSPSSSPTSARGPHAPRSSATAAGATCSPPTTPRCAASSRASAARRSRRSATAFSRCSTARRTARSGRRARSSRATKRLGVDVRAGLHTGECEIIGDDIGGMAVHIAARVSALAGPGEVIASGTTFGTVVGSGLPFTDLGARELRGVPGPWPLFRVV